MEDYLRRMEIFGFSGAVLVEQAGDILIKDGFGMADVEAGISFTTETGFFIASISKQFTAALILALEERGILHTDALIQEYLDTVPPSMREVTVHHLLSHTSGLLELEGEGHRRLSTSTEVLKAALESRLVFDPGTQFSYSNAGYAVLAALAEHVTGRRFEDMTQEFLFEPAGMISTSLVTDSAAWGDRELSVGYNGFLPQGNALLARPFTRELIGPAGVVTTLEDMYRWELALRNGTVLSELSLKKMFTPVRDNYGYGWSVWHSRLSNQRTAAHDGHIMPEGFNSYYIRLMEDSATVIVFANRGDVALAERIAWDMVRIMQGKEVEVPPQPADVPHATLATGIYEGATGARMRLGREGDGWYIEPLNQAAANFFLASTESLDHISEAISEQLLALGPNSNDHLSGTIHAVREQASRYGLHRGDEVIYSVYVEHEAGLVRTHLRHFLGNDTLYTRIESADGELVGGTDAGAFISGGRGLSPSLSRIRIAPMSDRQWKAYDLWGKRAVDIRIEGFNLVVGLAGERAELTRVGK